jgi:cysteine/O-acetylserine efflux protein
VAISWIPLVTFVFVTSFTPGPNNISSMSLGISHGYRRSLPYLSGIASGFFVVMCACAIVDTLLVQWFPRFEPYLRIAASLYIVWLAVRTFTESFSADTESRPLLRFHNGVLLQLLNPKAIAYGLTLYSSFLLAVAKSAGGILVSAVAFAAVSFSSVTTWALVGTTLARWLRQPLARRIAAAVLSLLLLYSAVESSGLLHPAR